MRRRNRHDPSIPRPLAASILALLMAGAGGVAPPAAASSSVQETAASPSVQPSTDARPASVQPLPEAPEPPSEPSPNLLPPSLARPLPAAVAGAPGWRPLPIWAGDVRSMAIAPDDPDLVLAGTTTGQLYLSRDGGASWQDAGAPLAFAGWVVSSLRWDPNRPHRLWMALWGVWGSGQVAFSDDLGK